MKHCRVCNGWCRVKWIGIPTVALCVLFAVFSSCKAYNSIFGPDVYGPPMHDDLGNMQVGNGQEPLFYKRPQDGGADATRD